MARGLEMVYCDQDMCESKLGRLIQAFRADRPDEWTMDEFIGMAEQMHKEIELLRQAEKDAARYRWIKENSKFGVGRCGVDWELYFEGPAPDNSAMIERHIDEAMQCK